MTTLLVPVDLGKSHHPTRGGSPLFADPTPALVCALIRHYESERKRPTDDRTVVAFHRGGWPTPDLIDALEGRRFHVACHPADLPAERLDDAKWAGLERVELDVSSGDRGVQRALDRPTTRRQVVHGMRAICAVGIGLGVIIRPGLPGSSHATALDTCAWLTSMPELAPQVARILPAIAFEDTPLARRAASGDWVPMTVAQAVTTCAAAMDLFEAAGVEVIRVGLQPGQDQPGRCVAGPVHPDLRGLVEVRRFKARLIDALRAAIPGSRVTVNVNPKDLSWAKGVANTNVRAVRSELGLLALSLQPDGAVPRGKVRVSSPNRQHGVIDAGGNENT